LKSKSKRVSLVAAAIVAFCLAMVASITPASAAPAPAAVPATAGSASGLSNTYCAGPIGTPGATGTWTFCENYTVSKDANGNYVTHPYSCKITNNTNKQLHVYRLGWIDNFGVERAHYDAEYWGVGQSYAVGCGTILDIWALVGGHWYTRASVQAAGSTGTSGLSIYSP
jgi:hypothetical protein